MAKFQTQLVNPYEAPCKIVRSIPLGFSNLAFNFNTVVKYMLTTVKPATHNQCRFVPRQITLYICPVLRGHLRNTASDHPINYNQP